MDVLVQTDEECLRNPEAKGKGCFQYDSKDGLPTNTKAVQKSLEKGFDEDKILQLLEHYHSDCIAPTSSCRDMGAVAKILYALLARHGTPKAFPKIWWFMADSSLAGQVATDILTRTMQSNLAECAPPSNAQIEEEKMALSNFFALRVRNGTLTAETPSSVELSDLAYFYAAIRGAAKEPGSVEVVHISMEEQDKEDVVLDPLLKRFQASQRQGDLAQSIRLGKEYAQALGYPSGVIGANARVGPSSFSGRMAFLHELALLHEMAGDFGDAATTYRKLPNGQVPPILRDHRDFRVQVEGVIRTEERSGNCGGVVAERLLEIDRSAYGTKRLTDAGYDLPRLYRGAIVTMNRDAGSDEIARAISRGPGSLREKAIERLRRVGPEDWARRVYAIPGLIDVEQRASLPIVLKKIGEATAKNKVVLLVGMGVLTRRPDKDPCKKSRSRPLESGELFGCGGPYTRQIRALGRSCETKFKADEADTLAKTVLKQLKDEDINVRTAAVWVLGGLASPVAKGDLEKLARVAESDLAECEKQSAAEEKCLAQRAIATEVKMAVDRLAEFAGTKRRHEPNEGCE
ncbi:MAG: HEAT repeat domain-containing protein [Deltaproteobacteria bacterium]|nr:HEAT repeat domain-containing protein [Deltaproteobacteria bacterium]